MYPQSSLRHGGFALPILAFLCLAAIACGYDENPPPRHGGDAAQAYDGPAGPRLIAGGAQSCVLDGDGELSCWGRGSDAALSGEFRAVAVGPKQACAVLQDGTVSCWGEVDAAVGRAPIGDYRVLALGDGFACGVLGDQTLACWGRNGSQQAEPPLGHYLDVHAGRNHACALEVDGTVACWGDDSAGQAVSPSGRFVALASGTHHNCAIREDGRAMCWGKDGQRQAQPPPGRFVQVSAGMNHSCAMRRGGTLQCWGNDSDGQATAPTGLFFTLASGDVHNCAVQQVTGKVMCWGNDYHGESSPPGAMAQLELPENLPQRRPMRKATGEEPVDDGKLGVSYGKVIVLGLHSLDGDDEDARAMSFGLRSASHDVPGYAIGDEKVTSMQLEIAHKCRGMDPVCLQGIAKNMGAAAVVYGSMRRAGKGAKVPLVVDLYIFEALVANITGKATRIVNRNELKRPALMGVSKAILVNLHEISRKNARSKKL